MRQPCVYILCSKPHGVLYIGVTSNLPERLEQHQQKSPGSFTTRYNVHRLVWQEVHDSIEDAITREKRLKKWRRQWKIDLIEKDNPDWSPLLPY
jgi:putative endonuclease